MNPSTTPSLMTDNDRWSILDSAYQSYANNVSQHYDEVLHDVAHRYAASGSLGKAEIGSLVLWKRLRADTRWARALMNTPDHHVREATAKAFQAACDEALNLPEAAKRARSELGDIPGFTYGDALASAVIVAAAPNRMAIYDRHAHSGLEILNVNLSNKAGRYGRYMAEIQSLICLASAHGQKWSARHIDLALYTLGEKNTRLGRPKPARNTSS